MFKTFMFADDLHHDLPDLACPSKKRKRFKTPFKPPARQRCLGIYVLNYVKQ